MPPHSEPVVSQQNRWVSFDDPPVTEAVVAVHFDPLGELSVAHMGLFWDDILSEEYPDIEERSPYSPPIERFDEGPLRSNISLELNSGPPPPRLWFKSPDEQQLIQLQRDWFACNWRRVGPNSEYERWPTRRSDFQNWYSEFIRFISERNLGKVRPLQCEVTYVNHIKTSDVWETHGQLDRILSTVSSTDGFLGEPEESRIKSQYVIHHDNQRLGRLHIDAHPVVNRKDGTLAIQLNLTARGAPLDASVEGVLSFLDIGRKWVTKGFKDVTTPAMHKDWGIHDE